MPVHWSTPFEFAQSLNAGSLAAPHVESYLNVVMAQALEMLGDDDAALKREIITFIDQETNHLRLHAMFNRRLYTEGYRGARETEETLKADMKRFLATKSHKFNLAYSAGFECYSHFLAKYVFEGVPHLFDSANPRMAELWRWHVSEEYEHRATCHDAYMRLYGAYFYRIYGLLFSFLHLMGNNQKRYAKLLEADRASMTPEEKTQSIQREKEIKKINARFFWSHMFHLLSPFYDPRKEGPAKGVLETLAAYPTA